MSESHLAGRYNWRTINRGDRHGGVINDAVDDGIGYFRLDRYFVRGNARNFPGKLLFTRKLRG
jgi:hypothetical protein